VPPRDEAEQPDAERHTENSGQQHELTI